MNGYYRMQWVATLQRSILYVCLLHHGPALNRGSRYVYAETVRRQYQMAVRIIPAYRKRNTTIEHQQLRVAAYCRVSTDLEEQESSYDAQVSHYTELINRTPSWVLAGIYSDEGISGTSTAKREGFQKMLKDCESHKIDYVITKSISRFARNTLDTLENIRKLKDLGIPVYFEKENINTVTSTGELLLTILASLAQQESQSISMNVGMGIRYRFQAGKPMLNHTRFLGYTKNRGENLRIVENEAKIVQFIYRGYLEGMSIPEIIDWLEEQHIKTVCGKDHWDYSVVKSILTNEKYIGDLLLQKSYTLDFLTKKRQKNKGYLPQYYCRNVHDPIVPREVFYYVQGLINQKMATKRRMKSVLKELIVCGRCGCRYKRFTDNKYGVVWRCSGRFTSPDDNSLEKRCTGPPVNESIIKKAVVKAFNDLPVHRQELLERQAGLQLKLGTDLLIRMNMIDTQIERIENAASYANAEDESTISVPYIQRDVPSAVEEFQEQVRSLQAERNAYLSEKGRYALQLAQIQSLIRLIDAIEGKGITPPSHTGPCTEISDFYNRTDHITQFGPVEEFDEWLIRRFISNILIHTDSVSIHFKAGILIDTPLSCIKKITANNK